MVVTVLRHQGFVTAWSVTTPPSPFTSLDCCAPCILHIEWVMRTCVSNFVYCWACAGILQQGLCNVLLSRWSLFCVRCHTGLLPHPQSNVSHTAARNTRLDTKLQLLHVVFSYSMIRYFEQYVHV